MNHGNPALQAKVPRGTPAGRIFRAWLLEARREVVSPIRAAPLAIRFSLAVDGICAVEDWPIIRITVMELVANAVQHGLYERHYGRIDVCVATDAIGTRVDVRDDGWGVGRATIIEGQGLRRLRALGDVVLTDHAADAGMTTIASLVPAPIWRAPTIDNQ